MVLREARPAGAPALLRVLHLAFEESRGWLDPPSGAHTETIKDVRGRLSRGAAIMALTDDEPVAFAFYQTQDERRAVEQECQGVRLGVRTQLTELIARYERLGYRTTRHMTHDGYAEPTYLYMEKRFPCALPL